MIDAAKLIDYNIWANRRILAQVETLAQEQFVKELGGSFPSVRLTLLHLLEADWIWLQRFRGVPFAEPPKDWVTDTASLFAGIWLSVQEETSLIVKEKMKNEDEEISFVTRKGAPYQLPIQDIVMHVTNHGTYHRGQIVNMLRMLGEKPVNTDYFIFCTQ